MHLTCHSLCIIRDLFTIDNDSKSDLFIPMSRFPTKRDLLTFFTES